MYYYGVDYGVDIQSVPEEGTEITINIPRKSTTGRGL
jgi:sensor histidine kinase YesM